MGGSFACPECGNPLELKGLTPGRQVRCGWCRTYVEVPFLPRMAGRGRGSPARRRNPRWAAWAWSGVTLSALILIAAGAGRMFLTRSRQFHEEALCRLSDAARDDEREGRFGPALATIEAALIEAGKIKPRDEARLAELRRWRDRIARREIETRLAEVAGLPPEQAVGACLTLLARIRDNPDLEGLEEAVGEQLGRARERSVAADLAAARRALDAGDAAGVLDRCERLVETADTLESETRRDARAEADAMVARIITQRGLIVGAIEGQFILGSDSSYTRVFHSLLADTLRQRGYVPRPASSFWAPLWDKLAPFHLKIGVRETLPEPYMESQNRTSSIDVSLVLNRTGKPVAIWEGIVNARTRIPLLGLPAYQASRLAVSDHRDPAVEHLLYEDARSLLVERLTLRLRSIPEARSPLSLPAPAGHS
jgi:hypothetical protein